jgi:hypothetical protein
MALLEELEAERCDFSRMVERIVSPENLVFFEFEVMCEKVVLHKVFDYGIA